MKKDEYEFSKQAFFGGRTNALKLYFDSKEDDDFLRYQDICSLYPTVQWYDPLPSGIPEWCDLSKEDISTRDKQLHLVRENFGFIECAVKPPKNLYHPVLPEKKNGKLTFDLLDKEGVWTSRELEKALEVGYQLITVKRALKFQPTTELFKSYVRRNLRDKVTASGWKRSDEAFETFQAEYKDIYNIDIRRDEMQKNDGKRSISKMLLNSLWGKLGQRLDIPQRMYIKDSAAWFKYLNRHQKGEIESTSETLVGKDMMFVTYNEVKEEKTSLNTTNIAVAAFVTANARLRLYSEMEKLGERVYYHDTDSIIYKYDSNGYNIPIGNEHLGQWTLENKGKIVKFVSTGPKSYSYVEKEVNEDGSTKEHIKTKFKGFTLNFANAGKVNFDTMKQLVDQVITEVTTTKMDFKRDPKTGRINTIYQDKKASFTYAKCQVNGYDTVPFGYEAST
jgi:hypothetical protein